MNTKAESTLLVVIVAVALVAIGIGFIVFGGSEVTSFTTLSPTCYAAGDESPLDVSECCSNIRRSAGCDLYSENEKLYRCGPVIVSQETIDYCG